MVASAHCPICFTNTPLDAERFSIFPCVYIELVDSHAAFQASVVEGLEQMGPDTPLVSVKKAGLKLEQVLRGGRPEDGVMQSLLKAVQDFRERVAPVFAQVETQKKEIETLREDLRRVRRDREGVQAKLRKTEPLQVEVLRLRTALSETERNTQEAIRLAEQAKDELGTVHASSNQWKKRVAELDQENKRYKDMLERHANNARLQKDKNRKLSKQVATLTEKLAAEERQSEALSAVSHDYDGDFSAHEPTRVPSSLHVVSSTPPSRNRRSFHDENSVELDFEGMPPPRFPSDWQIGAPGVLKKRNLNGPVGGGHRRVANPFPISLDHKGHPTRAVQLGPKSIVHVGR
ncbi:hypothetical protein NLJ89_g7971 [Agrocybe chaxingu]|uniref:Uncharacterized protein n=1 Tax=Agrocybe chaxingu TaxID=84603 RepID=A0A9W8MT62_9AGAR|nr:hypothetical protein NLJ89_g7971 [Agrocybe chaxingu]